MNISNSATATRSEKIPADSARKISLIAGIFFLLTFVHVAILPLYDNVLNNADFVLGAGGVTAVRVGAFVEIITIIANVATGVVLFQVLRRQQLAIALGYVAVRIFESTVIAIGTMCLLAIITLRELAPTGDAESLSTIASALVAVRDWTFVFGPGLCAGFGNGLLLGYLMYRSGLVPRNMALLGLIGGPLSLVGLTFVLFGQWEQTAPEQFLFTIVEIIWELSLGVYLVVKGFKASPLIEEARRDTELGALTVAPAAS